MKSNYKGGAVTTTIGRPAPTIERLRALLIFEPGIGLVWRVSRGSVRAGAIAGGYHHSGNLRIGIDRSSYRLDRIASLYQRGELEQGSDHMKEKCPDLSGHKITRLKPGAALGAAAGLRRDQRPRTQWRVVAKKTAKAESTKPRSK
jgi:hypothetical protein